MKDAQKDLSLQTHLWNNKRSNSKNMKLH